MDLDDYLLEDFWQDVEVSGHKVVKTVCVEVGTSYYNHGPDNLKSLGETCFIAEQAKYGANSPDKSQICAIVSHVDVTLSKNFEDVLNEHESCAQGLLRGVRHSGTYYDQPEGLMMPSVSRPDFFSDKRVQKNIRILGDRGYVYESCLFHTQLSDFYVLAKSTPNTLIVLNHLGTPLGRGKYQGRMDMSFEEWKVGISQLALCPNVFVKLGGLAMPDTGCDWHLKTYQPLTEDVSNQQRKYYLHAIDCFGINRCMFESNFPVEKWSVSYRSLLNAQKNVVSEFSSTEKKALFFCTAEQVYRI